MVVGPLQEIAGQTPATHAAALTVSDFVQFTSATVENFYNFLTSFTTPREEVSVPWRPAGRRGLPLEGGQSYVCGSGCASRCCPSPAPLCPPFLAVLTNPVQALRDAETEWVPLGALQRWHDVFLGKLEKDPSFWKRLHD